jgi:tetratricopeptide (TPR) repeat protein
MKIKFLFALLLGSCLSVSAQGYKDGIEYYKAGQYDNAIELLQRNLNDSSTDKALSFYYLGQSYLAKGDKAQAKSYFEKGVSANAECAYNYVGLGAVELLANNPSLAKDSFKKAQSLGKKNSEITVDIARAYYNADNNAKEVETYIAKAHKDSKDKEASIYILEGDRKADQKDWGGAATEYEQAITFDTKNPEGYVKYANVYYNLNPQYAIQKLQELLVQVPNSALGQRELAEKYYMNDQWAKAAEQYGAYIANPNHFPEDKARYAVLLYAGEKYDDAISISREVLAQDPNNFQTSRILVRSYNDLKQYDNALTESTKFMSNSAFAGKYNASDYATHADLLNRAGRSEESLATLEAGLKAFPENAGICSVLSDYYFDQKDYVKSAEYIEVALKPEANPKRSELYSGALCFLAAASSTNDDLTARKNYADRGIALMDRATEGLEVSETPVSYLRRSALLSIIGNNNITDARAAGYLKSILTKLDADSEAANPANAKNYLKEYVECYNYLAQYYADQQDAESSAQAKEQRAKYQALLDQVAK